MFDLLFWVVITILLDGLLVFFPARLLIGVIR